MHNLYFQTMYVENIFYITITIGYDIVTINEKLLRRIIKINMCSSIDAYKQIQGTILFSKLKMQ